MSAAVVVGAAVVAAMAAAAEEAALQVPAAAAEVAVALPVSVAGAAMVSTYTVDAHFLDAALAAVVVAAEAVGAAELAGYGRPPGAGSTLAGPNPHLRVKKLASRRSRSLRQ